VLIPSLILLAHGLSHLRLKAQLWVLPTRWIYIRKAALKVGQLSRKPMPPPPAPNGYAANFIPPRRRSRLPRQTTCTWFETIGIAERQAGDRSRAKRKANGQQTSKRRNGPSLWPMLRNATVSEEDNRALLLACFSQSLSLVGWITLLLQGPVPRSRTFWGKAMKSKLHPRFH
jgi:hypothetical protein